MFEILETVSTHPDVLTAKLVAEKVTFVERALWPALLAVATAREPWQLEGLGAGARRLLASLDEGQTVETTGPDAKAIERRLLARATSVHTPSGRHVMRLQPWRGWAAGVECRAINLTAGKRVLISALEGIGGGPDLLPWT